MDRQNRIKERETDGWVYRKPTSRHTLRRQAGRHANRQTDEQTASKQTDRQADTQTSREAARIGIHKDDRTNRQTHRQTERQPTGIHKDDRPADIHTHRDSRQPARQAGIQTDRRKTALTWVETEAHVAGDMETGRADPYTTFSFSLSLSLSHTHTRTDNDTWGRGLALTRHAHFCSPRSTWFSSLLLCHCNTHCLLSLHAAVYYYIYIYIKKKSKDVISSNIRLSGLLDSTSSQGKESLPVRLDGEKSFFRPFEVQMS